MVTIGFVKGVILAEVIAFTYIPFIWILNNKKEECRTLREDRNRLKEIVEVLDRAKGLTELQKEIREFVAKNEPCTPHEFITEKGVSPKKNKVYLEFSNLREKGWLKRVKNKEKGRRKLYALGEYGKYKFWHRGKLVEGIVPIEKG